MAAIEFAFNDKVHISTKLLLFKVNYERKLTICFEIRKKEKYIKTKKFVKEIKEIYKKAKVILKKL